MQSASNQEVAAGIAFSKRPVLSVRGKMLGII